MRSAVKLVCSAGFNTTQLPAANAGAIFQAIINIGVVTAVFPTKGMSLPFISAGLSNLLLMGMLLGIILNSQRNWGRAALPRGSGAMREVHA